ncbi:hypothetical protein O9929_28250 [Vibrio lentus]|nr:hypothetical protein [Vibrio lentus]
MGVGAGNRSLKQPCYGKTKRSRLSGDDVYVMDCVAQRHVFSHEHVFRVHPLEESGKKFGWSG